MLQQDTAAEAVDAHWVSARDVPIAEPLLPHAAVLALRQSIVVVVVRPRIGELLLVQLDQSRGHLVVEILKVVRSGNPARRMRTSPAGRACVLRLP